MMPKTQGSQTGPGRWRMTLAGAMLLASLGVWLGGCEMDSFFDPSVQGRWEKTPVVLPILEQLDVIDEPPSKVVGQSEVLPEDLVADVSEYVIGAGDVVNISIFELLAPNTDYAQSKQVDELGVIRFPVIGTIKAAGRSPSQLEHEISDILLKKNQIKEPTVSVTVVEGRQRTYSVVGEAQFSNSGIGTYVIPHNDFRLLEAMALAHGVPGVVKRLYIIRQVQLAPANTTATPGGAQPATPAPASPEELIDILKKGLDSNPNEPATAPAASQPAGAPPPSGLGNSLDAGEAAQWVNVNGKWVKLDHPMASPSASGAAPTTRPATSLQRVIEVPYAKLLEGNMQYNVVIRPGDIIRVPAPVIGNVYVGGQIARPGTYGLPGERDLNLKQLVFSAGGLSGIADPHRVDLIRRIGDNQEATVRLDLKAIFDGTQPDFFLKPNDTLNFGTNALLTPLAVLRNGFRASYGFGFILDRNFEQELFGNLSNASR